MEARWDSAEGELSRQGVVSSGELVTDLGDAGVVDERADTDDDSLDVFVDPLLPAAWVRRAVDQAGTINTLRDPLFGLTGGEDPDELANEVVRAWFDIDMSSKQELLDQPHSRLLPTDPAGR